mmetsp:Transcript_30853/g.60608  ORF Transcript_30853/g.60608 Transcript_30853/m.60608 type:complete len:98 (+) Transcript_30853:1-294(+)
MAADAFSFFRIRWAGRKGKQTHVAVQSTTVKVTTSNAAANVQKQLKYNRGSKEQRKVRPDLKQQLWQQQRVTFQSETSSSPSLYRCCSAHPVWLRLC